MVPFDTDRANQGCRSASMSNSQSITSRDSRNYVLLRPKPTSLKTPPRKSSRKLSSSTTRRVDIKTVRRSLGLCGQKGKSLCQIPACRIASCSLRTHREPCYPPHLRLQVEWKNNDIQTNGGSPGRLHTQRTPLTSIRPVLSGLPPLPSDDLDQPKFRELFHRFFTNEYDRLAVLLKPPPVFDAEKRRAATVKQHFVDLALRSPLYCINFIAVSYHQMLFQNSYRSSDSSTQWLHSQVMQLLREKLQDFTPGDVDSLLLTISTLVMFDITTCTYKTLETLRDAVTCIINRVGGIHRLSVSIAIVMTLDRLLAVHMRTVPLYAACIDPNICRPLTTPEIYGKDFETEVRMEEIDAQVVRFCADSCRVIEMMEAKGWSFDPNEIQGRESIHLQYFYFARERISNKFAHLNACELENTIKSRPILLAAQIVVYMTLMDNYLVAIPIFFANEIRHLFNSTKDVELEWVVQSDVLIWILFVLCSLRDVWDDHEWTLKLLQSALDAKYCTKRGAKEVLLWSGMRWPKDWVRAELENVRKFVWSDTRFCGRFEQACKRLEFATGSMLHPFDAI